jgi:serine acetyltransferase
VVVEDVPPHCLVVGNPARVVRRLDSPSVNGHSASGPAIDSTDPSSAGHHQ